MSDRRVPDTSPEALQRELRSLPAPPVDPHFEAAMREGFVRRAVPAPLPPAPLPMPAQVWRRHLIAACAAAAACLALVLGDGRSGWRAPGPLTATHLRIDGAAPTAAQVWREGALIETAPDEPVDLEIPGLARVQLAGGSAFRLPAAPSHWLAPVMVGALEYGEVRVTTGAGFHGTRLTIRAYGVDAIVTGTTLAVLASPDSTCVCVYEGAVEVRASVGRPDTVRAGTRRTEFHDGRAPVIEPIRAMETMKLQMLRAQVPSRP
jgi:ferric-dicitrate binding protein FerR (iron transport regulator)